MISDQQHESTFFPDWVDKDKEPIDPTRRLGLRAQQEYHIESILHEEDLGVLYGAIHERHREAYAILFLSPHVAPSYRRLVEVNRALRRTLSLAGDGVMPLHGVADPLGASTGYAYATPMGQTLAQLLAQGPLRLEQTLLVISQAASALLSLHRAGLAHGDLRPETLYLVHPDARSPHRGKTMLLRPCLHPLYRRPDGLYDNLPLHRMRYLAPEQISGELKQSDACGDLFALGAVLYECVTGVPLFAGDDIEAVLEKLQRPPVLLSKNPKIGLGLRTAASLSVLIAACCARDPAARRELVPSASRILQGLAQIERLARETPTPIAQPDDATRIGDASAFAPAVLPPPPSAPPPPPIEAGAPPPDAVPTPASIVDREPAVQFAVPDDPTPPPQQRQPTVHERSTEVLPPRPAAARAAPDAALPAGTPQRPSLLGERETTPMSPPAPVQRATHVLHHPDLVTLLTLVQTDRVAPADAVRTAAGLTTSVEAVTASPVPYQRRRRLALPRWLRRHPEIAVAVAAAILSFLFILVLGLR